MVALLDRFKRRRVESQKREEVRNRVGVLDAEIQQLRWFWSASGSNPAYLPTLVDFIYMDGYCRQILDPDLSSHEDFQSWRDECNAKLHDAKDAWRQRVDNELASVVAKSLSLPVSDSLLTLAYLCFNCKTCKRRGIEYPEVIGHACLYSVASPAYENVFDYTVARYSKNTGRHPWSSACLALSGDSILDARRNVISACGLDPSVTTRTAIDELDPMLDCRACSNPSNGSGTGYLVMTWRKAVSRLCTAVMCMAISDAFAI